MINAKESVERNVIKLNAQIPPTSILLNTVYIPRFVGIPSPRLGNEG